jgi:phosphate-selective porin
MPSARAVISVLALSTLAVTPRLAAAQADTGVKQSGAVAAPNMRITFTPGLRVQVREAYDNQDSNNDFFIARTRIKGKGNVFGIADYGAEVKIDNVGRFGREATAQVENAWLEFPIKPVLALRVGLYDAAFSRNALTSDSKLLLMDRSLVKDALTSIGFADNTVGLLAHGRPAGGHFEYSAGVFDNLSFEASGSPTARQADAPMVTGRIAFHLLDPATRGGYADYQSSYVGQGRRLAIGASSGYQPNARAGDEFDIVAWGADVFFNDGALTLEAEYDAFVQNRAVNPDINGKGWYAQGGYLVHRAIELVTRHQRLDSDDSNGAFANTLRWTSAGFNYYMRAHGLKLQAEYTFKRERVTVIRNDALQVQLQLDF